MSHDDFEFEPIPGLPAELPRGERLLWQGAPAWTAIRDRVFHVRGVGLYFVAVLVLRLAAGWYAGQSAHTIGVSMLWLALLGAATVGFLVWVAHMIARGTVYTLTTRRIVMRFGVVVPISINIPYAVIGSAALRTYADGTGDIPVRLTGDGRIAYPHLWPHARPWAVNHPQPMLRGVPGASAVARILTDALHEAGQSLAQQNPDGAATVTSAKDSAEPAHVGSQPQTIAA